MKKNITNLLIVCLYLFSCSNREEAQPPPEMANAGSPTEQRFVSKSAAQEVASLFFSDSQDGKRTKSDKVVGSVEPINDAIGTPLAYVINYKGGGWAIVSATQDYYPILAHSDESQFILDTTDMNSGLKAWINETSRAIESSEDLEPEIASQIALEWLKYTPEVAELRLPDIPAGNSPEAILCRNRLKYLNETYYKDGWSFMTLPNCSYQMFYNNICNKADQYGSPRGYTIVGIWNTIISKKIGPLLSTKWDQDAPYNTLSNSNNYPAGCVAIAMAQIMKFHRTPARFDWNNMVDTRATYATQFLIAEVGTAVDMQYGANGSHPSLTLPLPVHKVVRAYDDFGYSAILADHDNYDVKIELGSHGRPVHMSGFTDLLGVVNGHAWVCDGLRLSTNKSGHYVEYFLNDTYDNLGETSMDMMYPSFIYSTEQYHMNWGWGGREDGWYTDASNSTGNYRYNRTNTYVSPK